jgi:SAM-dependent methyltransferase
VPLRVTRPELFPDDTNPLPTSGSPEQAALLADEHELGNEAYLERLTQFSETTGELYRELVASCRDVLAQTLPGRPARVLDLCCGIGVVTLKLVESELPIDRVTLADLSPEMLRRATAILGRRLGARLPALETVQLDVLVDDLPARLAGPFELVVICDSFQHFPRARQAELLRQIRGLLVPSGVLVFQSHFKPLRPRWKAGLIDEYQARLRDHGAPERFVANVADHVNRFHNYVDLRTAYEWLEAAEFGFYDCVYRKGEIGILAAVN